MYNNNNVYFANLKKRITNLDFIYSEKAFVEQDQLSINDVFNDNSSYVSKSIFTDKISFVYNDNSYSIFENTLGNNHEQNMELYIGMLNEPFMDIEKVGIDYTFKRSEEVYEPEYLTFMGVKNVKNVKMKIKRRYKGVLSSNRNENLIKC